MPEAKRDLVSIDDLSNEEILALFAAADRFCAAPRGWSELCRGSILATLFFEPSTRTRLSFESAMLRLGGGVISATEGGVTSAAKGESLADTVRVVGGKYADIIVLRHGDEGAARVAARFADVPVVNAGDGAHEHPTQTLCDLYTLFKEKGALSGLEVALCGDLKHSRTIHSFAYALARFGASIVCVPFPGMEIPRHVLERLERDFDADVHRSNLDELSAISEGKDAVYVTPHKPHQQSLFTQLDPSERHPIDAIYMTRSQRERHDRDLDEKHYPSLGPKELAVDRFRETRVMHPLPRVDEISYDLDADPRAIYFRQAALGVPIRMALLAYLLGDEAVAGGPSPVVRDRVHYAAGIGLSCANPRCVANGEGRRYLEQEFEIVAEVPAKLRCFYCGWEVEPSFVGHRQSKRLHRANEPAIARILPERRVYFRDAKSAGAAGFAGG